MPALAGSVREAVSIARNGTLPDPLLRNLVADCALVLQKNHRGAKPVYSKCWRLLCSVG